MATYSIRTIGDPVLKQRATEIQEIDGKLVRLVDDMFDVMYDAIGRGLAAPQVGVQKRLFVYEHDDQQLVLINPEITEGEGEWTFTEGCLSIPGLYFEIVRPKRIYVKGVDLDGNEVAFETDEIEARVLQHELDHLDGTLMVDRLTADQTRAAKKHLLDLRLNGPRKGASVVIDLDGVRVDD